MNFEIELVLWKVDGEKREVVAAQVIGLADENCSAEAKAACVLAIAKEMTKKDPAMLSAIDIVTVVKTDEPVEPAWTAAP